MSFSKAALFCLLLALGPGAGAAVVSRAVPHPLPSHPGNIFFPDENIVVPAPPGSPIDPAAACGSGWRADVQRDPLARGRYGSSPHESHKPARNLICSICW